MNSRPWLNVSVRFEYLAANPTCELTRLFVPSAHGQAFIPGGPGWIDWDRPGEVNHIWSNHQRPDVETNLITLCRPVHLWFHAHLPEGRVLCLLAKVRKGEFDADVMHEVSGKHVLGWAEGLKFSGWLEQRRQELLREAKC